MWANAIKMGANAIKVWANAIKVWANAIKMPDQHKYENTKITICCHTAGASSQCYWDELMLLKSELMLLKCQINTNTNNIGFLLPTKFLKGVLKYSY